MARKLLLCDCGGTQRLDRDGIARATGMDCPAVATGLCTHQIDRVADALRGDDQIIIACQQEAHTFAALKPVLNEDCSTTLRFTRGRQALVLALAKCGSAWRR